MFNNEEKTIYITYSRYLFMFLNIDLTIFLHRIPEKGGRNKFRYFGSFLNVNVSVLFLQFDYCMF